MHLRGPHKRRSRASGARGHSSHETRRRENWQNKHADPVKPGRHEKAQGTRQDQSRGMSPAATRRQGLGEARLPPAVPDWGLGEATRVPRFRPTEGQKMAFGRNDVRSKPPSRCGPAAAPRHPATTGVSHQYAAHRSASTRTFCHSRYGIQHVTSTSTSTSTLPRNRLWVRRLCPTAG